MVGDHTFGSHVGLYGKVCVLATDDLQPVTHPPLYRRPEA